MAQEVITKVQSPLVRMAYVRFFEPDDNGDYGFTGIFNPKTATEADKERYRVIVRMVEEAFFKKFPAMRGKVSVKDWLNGKRPSGIHLPFRTHGEVGVDWLQSDDMKGCIMLPFRSKKRKPGIVRRDRSIITEADKDEVYSGMYGNCFTTFWAYEHKEGGKGVTLSLQSAMKIRDGEPMVSMSNPEADYAEVDVDAEYGDDEYGVDNSDSFI